ncbi:two-component sensor histidine kinase [Corallococcus macrosporus]|uniref:histidine kinase n=2 Tax=Myxococcaceae TaxID=31 RepID=F8CAR3_MYXFH|nr:two-component sensor histidine kinase [Corallococcus macrosporus]
MEARLAGLISTTVDAIISVDTRQRITLFNKGAERIFGYAAQQAVGQPLDLLLPQRYQQVHRQHVQRFAAGSRASRKMGERSTIVGRRKGGEEFPAEASISKVEVDGTTLLTVILRDISARKHAEEVLRDSEERFRTAFESAPIGMALLGLDGRLLNVNGAMCDMLGYGPGELLTRTLQDITWQEDRAPARENARRLCHGELRSYQSEARYIHKQGHLVSIQLTCSLTRDAQGKPLHCIAQVQDITARKQLEQALRFLAESGPQLASSLDPRRTIATVARLAVPTLADWCVVDLVDDSGQVQAVEALAASPEKSRLLHELLSEYPHDPSRQGHVVADVLETGRSVLLPASAATAFEAAAEDDRHLELIRRLSPASGLIVPLRTRERILGAVILWTSESGRHYGPRDQTLAEELASRAALAIDNARLHERSEQATHLRDEVLRVVAHDLRTPLNVIALSAGTLLKRAPEIRATDTRPLETIRKAVARANRLIQDLLDVARLEAGHLSVERAPVETAAFIKEAAELHRALAEAKSIRLTTDVPEDAPALLADPARALQVLSNLLGNAIKFTPEGGHVTVQAVPEGDMMRFSVRDTGPGIQPEHLTHLFEAFWQAAAGKKEGAGLGLAIAKGLVDAHGGRIWVDSSPGLGSTFSFTLPTLPSVEPRLTHHA